MMKHKHSVTYLCNSSALIQKQELANNKTYTFAEETANLLMFAGSNLIAVLYKSS